MGSVRSCLLPQGEGGPQGRMRGAVTLTPALSLEGEGVGVAGLGAQLPSPQGEGGPQGWMGGSVTLTPTLSLEGEG